jgi:hypothetical protein
LQLPVPHRLPRVHALAAPGASRQRTAALLLTLGLLGAMLIVTSAVHGGDSRSEDRGSAAVLPGSARVVTWTTQQVVYTTGSVGVAVGGGLKVQLPKSWISSSDAGLSLDPSQAAYVTAVASSPAAHLLLGVVHAAIDGRRDTLDWTAVVTVTGASLAQGDVITCTFGDTSGGGQGLHAPLKADVETVRVAVDPAGDGVFALLDDLPEIEAVAGAPFRLLVAAPSQVTLGVPFRLALVAQDSSSNATPTYHGTVTFASTDPQAILPPPYSFTPDDRGIHTFEVTLNTPGPAWITATDTVRWPAGVPSNPVHCQEVEQDLGIYWGDVHSHTNLSADAQGRTITAFSYARDVARLDFYATTDHAYLDGGYTPEEWVLNSFLVAQYDDPGVFVTLLGYEWTVWEPDGHRTVLFRDAAQELVSPQQAPTVTGLWAALQGKQALTIPHHTGKQWRDGTTATVEWDVADDTFQRSVEIYSSHGQSEMYDPNHPLSYENVGSPGVESVPGPHYARDGWAMGRPLGVMASGDDHTARPGQPNRGLTAVLAPSLTREAVFDAIAAGHTYATTGQRIWLDFRVDGLLMGDVLTVTLPHSPRLDVQVAGTDVLSYVQVCKYDGITYTVPFSVTAIPGRQAAFTWTDMDLSGNALYYIRLAQVHPVYGRTVMAWSSPVWVKTLPERRSRIYLPLVVHR